MSIHHASTSCPITHPHVFSLRPSCFLHVPWRHTFNLHYTCAHHVYTMRNPCPLMSSPNPIFISRLFPILLDPKSFQTVLDSITWLPGHVLSIRCRLIKYYCPTSVLTLTLLEVCPHTRLITQVNPNILNHKPPQRWSSFSRTKFKSAISKCSDLSAPGPDKLT